MKLFYQEYGTGTALIILHGLYGSGDNWHSIAKILSEKYKVFTLDQRNHGRSPHSQTHSFKDMVEDLYEFLADNNISKCYLMGHSMGGKTAMLFAKKYPQLIKKLIIVDISPISFKNDTFLEKNIALHSNIIDTLRKINLSTIKSRSEADKIAGIGIEGLRERQFLLKNLYRNEDGKFKWRFNLGALYRNLNTIFSFKFDEIDEEYSIPTLFIKGEHSNYIRPEDFSEIKSIYKNASIVTIKNTGHWVHAEDPEKFIEACLDFLV